VALSFRFLPPKLNIGYAVLVCSGFFSTYVAIVPARRPHVCPVRNPYMSPLTIVLPSQHYKPLKLKGLRYLRRGSAAGSLAEIVGSNSAGGGAWMSVSCACFV